MKLFFGVVVAVALGAGCNKPAESDCRRAVQRIRELTGTAHEEAKNEVEAAVRSCRGNGTKESVKCAIEASSLGLPRQISMDVSVWNLSTQSSS